MLKSPFAPFKIALAVFGLWAVLPVLGVGLESLNGQTIFEHWYMLGLEYLGGTTVAMFVLSSYNRSKLSKPTTPPQDVVG